MDELRFLRFLTVAGGIAAAVFFFIWSLNVLTDPADIGWGLFCLAVASTAHWVETNNFLKR